MTAAIRARNDSSANHSDLARTAYGHEFDPLSLHWRWRGPLLAINLNFEWIARSAPGVLLGSQIVLSWIAENLSDYSLRNNHVNLVHFLKNCQSDRQPIAEIGLAHILNYRSSNASRNGRLSSLASLLRLWQDLEQPGLNPEVVRLLDGMTLKGNEKGKAVSTMDPISGPLSDLERESLLTSLHDAFAAKSISLRDYCLALIDITLAPRPVQLAALKIKDLIYDETEEGLCNFRLMVPRAKQRLATARETFTERPLTRDFGMIVKRLADTVEASLSGILDDPSEGPLFLSTGAGHSKNVPPPGFEFHFLAPSIGFALQSVLRKLDAYSERTGETIKAGAARLRRTLGTNAAKEGHGPRVIAALLDHTDTQNVGVYVETSAEFIQHLDRAMAMQLAPLAQAFRGTLVQSEKHARLGDKIENRITGPDILGTDEGLGTCGDNNFCALVAPLACYTCRKYQPWLEGPHDLVLDWLLRERERQMSFGDPVIARIRDRIILAVAAVVLACLPASGGNA
jgi:integrase